MAIDNHILKLHEAIISIISLAISRLYKLPIEELRIADPSLEEIARLCSLFNKLVEGTDIDGQFTEAIDVIGEAAKAVKSGSEQTLTDCAYHLEDILSRISSH